MNESCALYDLASPRPFLHCLVVTPNVKREIRPFIWRPLYIRLFTHEEVRETGMLAFCKETMAKINNPFLQYISPYNTICHRQPLCLNLENMQNFFQTSALGSGTNYLDVFFFTLECRNGCTICCIKFGSFSHAFPMLPCKC